MNRKIGYNIPLKEGYAIAEWFRHYGTNQKVEGSRTDKVNTIYKFT
jgi:hypothetical protein